MNYKFGIIGINGQMGSCFANFLREQGLDVIGSDINTKLSNLDVVNQSDYVIVSVPIKVTQDVLAEIVPHMHQGQCLMDLTGLKKMPLEIMSLANCEVIGLHPMFPGLPKLDGQNLIVCKTEKSADLSSYFINLLIDNGLNIMELTADEHDVIMSYSQGLVHFWAIVFAYTLMIAKIPVESLMKYCSKASYLKVSLALRIINQNPELYGSMQIFNPFLVKLLERLLSSADQLLQIIKSKDLDKYCQYYLEAKDYAQIFSEKAYLESNLLIEDFISRIPKATVLKSNEGSVLDFNTLATLGPAGTYSGQAAKEILDRNDLNCNIEFCNNISHVCKLVNGKQVKYGLLPFENMIHGSVVETLDNLFKLNLRVIDRITIDIIHSIAVLPEVKKTNIQTVLSHPQALAQCSEYLKNNLPNVQLVPVSSTAQAVVELKKRKDRTVAVVASNSSLSKDVLVEVLDVNIADNKENQTRFVLVESGVVDNLSELSHSQEIYLALYFEVNKVGNLSSVLRIFEDLNINLTKIESRPSGEKFGRYIFFITFDSQALNPACLDSLMNQLKSVAELKIIGAH